MFEPIFFSLTRDNAGQSDHAIHGSDRGTARDSRKPRANQSAAHVVCNVVIRRRIAVVVDAVRKARAVTAVGKKRCTWIIHIIEAVNTVEPTEATEIIDAVEIIVVLKLTISGARCLDHIVAAAVAGNGAKGSVVHGLIAARKLGKSRLRSYADAN